MHVNDTGWNILFCLFTLNWITTTNILNITDLNAFRVVRLTLGVATSVALK